MASLRPRDQRRHQIPPSPLFLRSFQSRDQSSHRPLPIAPQQRLLLARPLPPDQAPALATLKPSSRPPTQPQDQPSRFRLLLALEQPLLRSLPQPPPQPLLWPSVLRLPRLSRNPLDLLSFTATCRLVTANSRPSAACWFDFDQFSGYTIVVIGRGTKLMAGA